MADRRDEQPAEGDDERRPDDARPPSFDFKLRLGTRESTAALADHATGELVQLQPIEWDAFSGVREDEAERSYQTDSELQSIIVELANKIATPDAGPAAAPPAPAAPVAARPAAPTIAPLVQLRPLIPVDPPSAPAVSEPEPEPVHAATPSLAERLSAFEPEAAIEVEAAAVHVWEPVVQAAPEPLSWTQTPTPEPVAPVAAPAPVAPVVVPEPVVPVAPVAPVAVQPAPVPEVPQPVEQAPPAPEPAAADAAPSMPTGWPVDPAPSAGPAWTPQPGPDPAWGADAHAVHDPARPRVYGLGDSRSVPAVPAMPSGQLAAQPPRSSTGPVAMTPVSPITPIGGPVVVPPTAPPVAPPRHLLPVDSPPPLQLAKIERRPEAARTTKPVDFQALLGQAGLAPTAVKKRKKRHPFRVLFKLLIVLGILGAGLYFGKKYVLDMRWSSEVKPYAEAIADQRGLEWDKAVKVETLPLAQYAERLATTELGMDVAALADHGVEWRAMGLAGPASSYDLPGIGASAMARRPAFYDPSSQKIYIVDGVVDRLHDMALYRALAMALLDQTYHWSRQLADADPGQRLAIETLYDGDATATAQELAGASAATDPNYLDQQQALADRAASMVGDVPRYVVDQVAGSDAAVARFAVLPQPDDRDALLQAGAPSDAAVFDGVRGLTSVPLDLGGAAGSGRGMMYWYYVLAGALPEVDAWNAALAWNGDEVVVSGTCVNVSLSAVDEGGRQRLLDALTRWSTALGRTDVTVQPEGTDRIRVDACDPRSVDTLDVPSLPHPSADIVPFGRAAAEQSAIQQLSIREAATQECVVNAVRAFDVVPIIRQGASADLDAVLHDIETSCSGG